MRIKLGWFKRALASWVVMTLLAAEGVSQVVETALVAREASVEELSGASSAVFANLEALPMTKRLRAVALDVSAFDGDRALLSLFDDCEFVAEFQDIGYTGIQGPSWTGRLANGGSAAFVFRGGRVSGSVVCEEGCFEIFPLGDGLSAVVERDLSALPECGAERFETLDVSPGVAPLDVGDVGPAESVGEDLDAAKGDTPTANRVRVIVAYTTSARDDTDSVLGRTMRELVDLAVVESNQGYANSGVTQRMELACLYHTTSGTETTVIQDDVADFRNSGDSKWNEIHGLRSTYDADMCCLITDGRDTDWCGWAFGFDYTDYANMFQVTAYNCATGVFTFAHEFGHTQGCRHNDDSTLTPFPYGHGFRNGSNWRTVMGLANGTGAPRLNFWSNPAINSPIAPFTAMGTAIDGNAFANDSESALDVGDATVVNHEGTPVASIAPNGDQFDDDEYADKIVTESLAVGDFTANSGSEVQFRAGDRITLNDGFRARAGSVFRARIAGPLGDPKNSSDDDQASDSQEDSVSDKAN